MATIGRIILCAVASLSVFAQSPMPITGVKEPPEWCGSPKVVPRPPEALKALAEAFPKDAKDPAQIQVVIEKLDQVLLQVPTYSDGYLMRAVFRLQLPNGGNTASILADIDKSISTRPAMTFESAYKNLSQHYSIRGRVKFDAGRFKDALDDLDTALKQDFDGGERLFNSSGVKPDAKATDSGSWSLNELNELERRFPRDYRIQVFQGLYQLFFCTFDKSFYAPALQKLEKAAKLNPKSPVPQFCLGTYWSKRAFWTPEAWASDKAKAAIRAKAIAAYSAAIKLDPSFEPAYAQRASQFHGLQRYADAIKDYERVLKLNPENRSALADMGTARLRSGAVVLASHNLSRAIGQRDPNDDYLHSLYEYRGDAYLKMGMFQDAIKDYSKAIELQFGKLTILLSLKQIRGLYPEYNSVPDDLLLRKIHAIFWPNLSFENMSKSLLVDNGKWAISLVNELYEKRGDAYLRAGDFRHGVQDLQRIFEGIPNFAPSTDRWRSLGKERDEESFIDVQTVEFPNKGKGRLWIKTNTKNSSAIRALEFDVPARRMRIASTTFYAPDGQARRTLDVPGPWEAIIPGSKGEAWLRGLSSN